MEQSFTKMPVQILGGIADTTAQTLTSIKQRVAHKNREHDKNDSVAIEIHDLDKKVPWPDGEIGSDNRNLPPAFDFERLTRFVSFGFLMAPLQHKWFSLLSSIFPISKEAGTVAAMKCVAFDQLIFAPIGMRSLQHPTVCCTNGHRSGYLLYVYDNC